jgi:hypothetical protein
MDAMTQIVSRTLRVAAPPLYRFLHRYYRENTRYNRLARRIGRRLDWTVATGPFAGTKYVRNACCGRVLPKLVGSYEQELWPALGRIARLPISTVINIGCAEGYYATGLARILPEAMIHAFDCLDRARDATRLAAEANHSADRIHISGACDAAALAQLPLEGALIVMDCEGAEIEILDPELAPGLVGSWMLVELHDFLDSRITPALRRRFSGTHAIEIIHAAGRDASDFPALAGLSRAQQIMALDEDRQWHGVATQQAWAFLTPKQERR